MKYGKWEVVQPDGSELLHSKGHVFFVQDTETGSDDLFVLKIQKQGTMTTIWQNPDGSTEEVEKNRGEEFKKEIKLAAMMDHPNVIKVVDYDLEHETPYMVTEYCKGGSLSDSDFYRWSVDEKIYCHYQICLGTMHIQGLGYARADGGLHNIFLKADGRTPVIGDLEGCPEANTESIASTMVNISQLFWSMIQGKVFERIQLKEMDLNKRIQELNNELEKAEKEKAELFESTASV
ncbi:MAG: protein kinase [Balneolaceae bacterium]